MPKTTGGNTYLIVESAELVMKTSEFLGCHEHDVNSLTWPLWRKNSQQLADTAKDANDACE